MAAADAQRLGETAVSPRGEGGASDERMGTVVALLRMEEEACRELDTGRMCVRVCVCACVCVCVYNDVAENRGGGMQGIRHC